jgi:RNA polymerase sigma factor (sigma-70 family)
MGLLYSTGKTKHKKEGKTKAMEALDSLVRAAQEGKDGFFDCIVERFQDMACASAYAMIGDVQLAEDVAQEAFLEAYLNLAKLREPAAFPSWFRRIIFKQADRLTRGKHLATSPLEEVTDLPMTNDDPTEVTEANEMKEQVQHALSVLPERERIVIMLFYGTGYALKDIATFLEIPVTSVKKRLYDARQRLKDEMIDVLQDILQERRSSISDTFPAKVRLLLAARLGDIESVRELLSHSPCLLNMKMEQREVRHQRVQVVEAGFTALHEAAMHNQTDLVQLLFEYGANSNVRTSHGLTPLHGAVLYHCHETAAIILEHGANTELPHYNGLTALHLATMKGDIQMVRLLLTYGATVDCRSRYAHTPLHWAAIKGHVEIMHLLLAHGADQDACDATGRTPHNWAISRENATITTLLQERITR